MSKLIDLTGKRYNHLTVIGRVENAKGGVAQWKCICDCGNITIVRGQNLKSGAVKSCGCLRHIAQNKTHDMSKTKIYRLWANIKTRCYHTDSERYKDYGGRGIKMCEEWRGSFDSFRKWAFNNGYSGGLTIERIDNDGDYCPENCKWIPRAEQSKNRRSVRQITYNGKTQILADWCRELNLNYDRTLLRIKKYGWSFERAISEPVHAEKRNKKSKKINRKR